MISKNDCIILLNELKKQGVDTNETLRKLIRLEEPDIEIIKFINDSRQLDLTSFYKKIRKSYNNKKSSIYINIVKEITDPNEVLITLAALETQILIYSKNVEDKVMFLNHSRANEISMVLSNYFKTFDITNCIKLLRIIKADIKATEYLYGKTTNINIETTKND